MTPRKASQSHAVCVAARRWPRRSAWLGLLVIVSLQFAAAQQLPAPDESQIPPNSPSAEEAAAFEKLLAEQNPDEQIRLVEDFLLQYPESRLKEYAYQAAMQAYQAKNDYARVLTYGELTLQENPDNLTALLILAAAIPEVAEGHNGEERAEELADAERYANRSLEVLLRMEPPARLTAEEWTKAKNDAEATAHGSLGLIALIRGDFARAEIELREAALLTSRSDPILFYRLGLAYAFQKKYAAAIEVLDRAEALGGVKIQGADGRERNLVAEAREFAARAGMPSESDRQEQVAPPNPESGDPAVPAEAAVPSESAEESKSGGERP